MSSDIASLLEHDHEELAQLLQNIDTELIALNATRAYENLDLFWARLAMHIRAENVRLFPALLKVQDELLTGKDDRPSSSELFDVLTLLRSDHDYFMTELTNVIKVMRKVGKNEAQLEEVRQRLGRLKSRLEKHNQLEEEQAYLWPAKVFDAPTLEKLAARVRRELANLPPRFA